MDQGISTEEYGKATYGKLVNTKVKNRNKLSVMWPYGQTTVCHWKRKGGDLTKQNPMNMYTMLFRVILD